MQVLEMEEAESLVGTRKKLGNNRNASNNNKTKAAACALRSDFLPKVVVLACFILLGILFLSVKDDDNNGNQQRSGENGLMGDVEIKTPVPMLIPTNAPNTVAEQDEEKEPEEKTTPEPSAAPKDDATLNPTESEAKIDDGDDDNETTNNDNDDDDVKNVEDDKDDDSNPFGYSHHATILPLVDHPLLPEGDEAKAALIEKYGKWRFWDGDEDNRPAEDYCGKYPNRDIPGDEFPDDAWQGDAVFVNHILNDADKLIARTMEAIFVEYGHGKPLDPDGMAERMKMFRWSREDLSTMDEPPEKYGKNGDQGSGGWTTRRSFDGLVRRLLHAMMTQDTFTVVMGGHSAAVGQGYVWRYHACRVAG